MLTRLRKGLYIALMLLPCLSAKAGKVTYVYTDPQGTPLAEADASGNITSTFDYKPYGAQALGNTPSGPGYTGHVADPDTSLIYMQARYYDPITGRFLSVDPVGPDSNTAQFNRYEYAHSNTYRYVDPDGRESCEGGPNCKVYGTPQETGTPGHAEASKNIGDKMMESGNYVEIHYNRNQSSVAGFQSAGSSRADVAGKTASGQIDTVEITSPSQTTAQMNAKGAQMQAKLPPSMQGVHKTYSITEGLSSGASLPRAVGAAGKVLGAAGPAVGIIGAILEARRNPNMSQQEFMYRAVGMYEMANDQGLIPKPTPGA